MNKLNSNKTKFGDVHVFGNLVVEGNLMVTGNVTINGTYTSLNIDIEYCDLQNTIKICKENGITALPIYVNKEEKRKEENRVDRYLWHGWFATYEVGRFEYYEDRNVLTLYTFDNRTIVEISFADSDARLETFTDDEINEYLLDYFEEYTLM